MAVNASVLSITMEPPDGRRTSRWEGGLDLVIIWRLNSDLPVCAFDFAAELWGDLTQRYADDSQFEDFRVIDKDFADVLT